MKNIFCLIAMELAFLYSFAQTPLLKKGERLPPHEFAVRIGDSLIKTNLEKYKDKFLLIDFWGPGCLDCLASMPKMLGLQNEFKNKLSILLVTKNTAAEIQGLFSKFSKMERSAEWLRAAKQLPIVTDDSFFVNLFPHKGLPTHVWICDSLRYYSMAYSTSANSETISRWVSQKNVRLDELINRDIDPRNIISLLEINNVIGKQPQSYSILLNRLEYGMGGAPWVDILKDSLTGRPIGIACLNSSIPELYKIAYSNDLKTGYTIPDYRIIWRIALKDKIAPPPMSPEGSGQSRYFSWADTNTFCFLLRLPTAAANNIHKEMQRDLDSYFQMESAVNKLPVKCRILKVDSGRVKKFHQLISTKHSREEKYIDSDTCIEIQNLPMDQLYSSIKKLAERQGWSMPFLNEIPFKGPIHARITSDNFRKIPLKTLNVQLSSYGLKISEEYRILDMLVIKDRGT